MVVAGLALALVPAPVAGGNGAPSHGVRSSAGAASVSWRRPLELVPVTVDAGARTLALGTVSAPECGARHPGCGGRVFASPRDRVGTEVRSTTLAAVVAFRSGLANELGGFYQPAKS